MKCSYKTFGLTFLTLIVVFIVAGCSRHEDHPATPVMSSATPTFRSSTNSYDQPNTPEYTQPGINHGERYALTPIPPVDRFDQNSALANQVYQELQQGLGMENVRYLTVQTKGKTALVSGTVGDAKLKATAIGIATKSAGVAKVIDKIRVQS